MSSYGARRRAGELWTGNEPSPQLALRGWSSCRPPISILADAGRLASNLPYLRDATAKPPRYVQRAPWKGCRLKTDREGDRDSGAHTRPRRRLGAGPARSDCSLAAVAPSRAQTPEVAIVASVSDGDTLRLRDGRELRLLQIDAPALGKCYSLAARAALLRLTPPRSAVALRRIPRSTKPTAPAGCCATSVDSGSTSTSSSSGEGQQLPTSSGVSAACMPAL